MIEVRITIEESFNLVKIYFVNFPYRFCSVDCIDQKFECFANIKTRIYLKK